MSNGPIEQEAKKGHKLLSIGHDTYAEVSSFKGKTYASIRRWFQADDGKWYRTKNGLNMILDELQDILASYEEIIAFFSVEAEQPFDDNGDKGW